jgi:signal transduction histidine kinase
MSAQAPERPDQLATLFTRLDQLRQAERQAASARVASVIGHLIGTPLNVIAGRAALIRSNNAPEAVAENVRRIEEQVERLAQRIRRLIEYLSVVDPPKEPRTVAEVLDETVAIYEPVAAQKGITLRSSHEAATACRVDCHPALLVLTSVLSLATRTGAAGDEIGVFAKEHAQNLVLFELSLPGLPAPPSRVDRLEPPEQGSSYDADAMQVLSICLGIARRSGGGLDVVSAASGKGVVVRFECARV